MQDADSWDGGEVNAENAVGLLADGQSPRRIHDFTLFDGFLRCGQGRRISLGTKILHELLHLGFAIYNLALILAIERNSLPQCEEMLSPVIAHQAFRDSFRSGPNAGIAELG